MKVYSQILTEWDVRDAFLSARVIDGQDIYPVDIREFRPRGGRGGNGVEFFAESLAGKAATAHRAIGSYPLDDVARAASWSAYGYVIARLFAKDPGAKIGVWDGVEDFRARVPADASRRRESDKFLELLELMS